MPAAPTALYTYFSPSESSSGGSHQKNRNLIKSSMDKDLKKAIQISEAEARISNLSEEEMIQQAIEASKADVVEIKKELLSRKRQLSPMMMLNDVIQGVKKSKKGDEDSIDDEVKGQEVIAPILTSHSFNDKEEVINRLNGSLDLLSCKGWIKMQERLELRNWMLNEMAWHRVSYTQPRTKQKIITPRFTATFGKDDTGAPDSVYPVKPKVIPPVLDSLRAEITKKTGAHYNAIIVNFYQDGKDSISYHADDETFLGPLPTIASISLGSSRDFYLRRKFSVESQPSTQQFYTKGIGPAASRPTEKMRLDDGDLVVMRGKTQAEWEHSIPKRANAGGRINITFRKVVSVKGTNNFQRYNRGLPTDDDTRTYRWDPRKRLMIPGEGGV